MSTTETNPEPIRPRQFQRFLGEMTVKQRTLLLAGAIGLALLCLIPPHKRVSVPLGSGREVTEEVIDFARLVLMCLATVLITAVSIVAVDPFAKMGGRVVRFLWEKLKRVPTAAVSAARRSAPPVRKWWYLYLIPVILFLWLVWPTPYTYRKDGDSIVRINRITQGMTFLYNREWLSGEDVSKREADRKAQVEEAGRMEAKARAEDVGRKETQAREERIEAQKRAIQTQMEAERKEAVQTTRSIMLKEGLDAALVNSGAFDHIAPAQAADYVMALREKRKRERDAAEADRLIAAKAAEEQRKKDALTKVSIEITGQLATRYEAIGKAVIRGNVPCFLRNGIDRNIRRVGFSLIFEGKEYKQADLLFQPYSWNPSPGPGQRVECSIDAPNVPENADKLQYRVVVTSVEFDRP